MKKGHIILTCTAFVLSLAFAAKAATVKSDDGCVNLREGPFIDAPVITCLEPETYIEPVRMEPTGRFAWYKDESDRLWYMVTVPDMNLRGWMIESYIDYGE